METKITNVGELLTYVASENDRKNLALPEHQSRPMFGLFGVNNANEVVIPNDDDIKKNKNEFYADLVDNNFLKATGIIFRRESETMAAINQYLKDTNYDGPIKERLYEIIANYNKHNDENNTERAKLNFDNNGNLTLEEHKTGIFEKIKDFCQRNKRTLIFLEYTLKFWVNIAALLLPLAAWIVVNVAVGLVGLHFGIPLEAIGAMCIVASVLGIITWNAVGKFAKELGLDKPFIRINNWLANDNGDDKSLSNVGDNLQTKFSVNTSTEEQSRDIKTNGGGKEVDINPSKYEQGSTNRNSDKMK